MIVGDFPVFLRNVWLNDEKWQGASFDAQSQRLKLWRIVPSCTAGLHLFAACGFPSDTPKVNKLLKSFFSVLLTQLCQSNHLCQYFQISPPDFWLVKTGLDVKSHFTQLKPSCLAGQNI